MSYFNPPSLSNSVPGASLAPALAGRFRLPITGLSLMAALFLVSVPVFFQAPLVRSHPWLSLCLTGGWLALSKICLDYPRTRLWGDLLLGFAGSWWAGSLYWGWMRWEPFLHLPVESLALPLAIWGLSLPQRRVGSCFYLGSLIGTAITDLYFYLTGLMPYWRQLMRVESDWAMVVFQQAIAQIQNPWGISWAIVLGGVLLILGFLPLGWAKPQSGGQSVCWWTFSGAILGTILVDSLFWLAANATT